MATTYLQICNEILREVNEVELTSATFSSSVGIQTHVKDIVNRAYLDVVNEEPQWPFLSVAESGATDPMYGNTYVETVAGTRWYELKPASSSILGDYGYIDWDNFYLTTVGVSGESAPYTARNLRHTTIEEWKDYFRVSENLDDADTQSYGVPSRVVRSPDARNFGLSPIPDQVYRIWFFAFNQPTKLDLYSDAVVFPDVYVPVIISKARYYIHQFNDNDQGAAFALEDYKRNLKNMRLHLMEPDPGYFKDDRIRFI